VPVFSDFWLDYEAVALSGVRGVSMKKRSPICPPMSWQTVAAGVVFSGPRMSWKPGALASSKKKWDWAGAPGDEWAVAFDMVG
jgi:hypothetical protein